MRCGCLGWVDGYPQVFTLDLEAAVADAERTMLKAIEARSRMTPA